MPSFAGPEGAAVKFVLCEPVSRIAEIIRLLEEGAIYPRASRPRVAQAVVIGGGSVDRTMDLLRAWSSDQDAAPRLRSVLEAMLEIRTTIEARGVEAELVWTGHKPSGSPLRSTPEVVSEMLDSASDHVVVVSYSVWLGQTKAAGVLKRVSAARERGCRVTLVVDRSYGRVDADAGHNLEELRTKWPEKIARPDVYSWGSESDSIAKLHAKLVVVDREELLITSANLTGHGMAGNLELGTRLRGRPAGHAHQHVMDLIRAGVFEREELW